MKTITKTLVKEYFSDHWDVTFEQLIKELSVDRLDIDLLQKYLGELIDEGWVRKSGSPTLLVKHIVCFASNDKEI